MCRIIYSFLLGSTVILMSSLPSIINADMRGTIYDAPQGKIVGGGVVERQSLGGIGRTDPSLRSGVIDRYRDNAARYYSSNSYYGTYDYPTSSYYSTTPTSSYYGTYGYPNTLDSSYYSPYGYPTGIDSYYGTYGYNYPSYSSYSPYPPHIHPYGYSGYRPYYPSGNMYNPNTVFVNPPSSLNSPRYPVYSESYIYR